MAWDFPTTHFKSLKDPFFSPFLMKMLEGASRSNTVFAWCLQTKKNDKCAHRWQGGLQQPETGGGQDPGKNWAVEY